MNSRLDRIKDWPVVAKTVGYSAIKVAQHCQVTPRQLERYFRVHMHSTPHKWLREQRMRRAVELISSGMAMKEAAVELGYKDAAHFAHDFKEYFGVPPSAYPVQPPSPPTAGTMSLLDKRSRV